MKVTAVASWAIFGLAAAQDLGQLPDCATTCLTKFTTGSEIGGCDRLNAKCICASNSFLDGIACCLADACNQDDQKKAVQYARTFCGTQGVQVPDAVVCKSASAGPSPTVSSSETVQASGTAARPTPTASTETKPSKIPNTGPQGASAPGFAGLVGGLAAALAFL